MNLILASSYPCVLRPDQIDLLSAVHHFTLSMGSSKQTVNVCVKWPKVRYSKPCASTTAAFEAII